MKDIDEYINSLYENQNIGADAIQRNLYKKEDYLKLLKDVLETLRDNKDANMDELRNKLYEKSNLEELLKEFFLERKMAPGAVISYGTKNFQERITIGNKQEVVMENGILVPKKEEMENDIIFDLASVTKLFTSLSILKLVQSGEINLSDEVTKYAPEFTNLKGITIYDLLKFEPLETKEKIDRSETREEAEKIVFTASRRDIPCGANVYNDVAAMVLKYVVEKVSGINYKDFVQQEILDKVGMDNTFVNIPNEKLNKVANSNYDGRYYQDGNFIIRDKAIKGVSTDDKARILGQPEGILSGHAGLFSTSFDMTKLARALIGYKIINLNIRDMMAKNRTGFTFMKPDGKKNYCQYFGMLVYSKNPELSSSEVQHSLSGKSFASAGWSGTQQTIDPINNLNFTLLSNRSHNRMTFIDASKKELVTQKENGMKTIVLPNEYEMIDATRYAWERDTIVRRCIELVLQYKMLEDITGYSKDNDKIEENNIQIK
ncbi:MAG: beta-lactamase family protein [Bacilli bacterium]|nr:beta-lactamase family protein [Bacilli bacterium]